LPKILNEDKLRHTRNLLGKTQKENI